VRIKLREQEQPLSAGAEDCFRASERIFIELEREEERARTLREWALYELERGNRQHGMSLWAEARAIFARLGAQPEVDRMEEIYAEKSDFWDVGPGGAPARRPVPSGSPGG
jgi:hypothetical protein